MAQEFDASAPGAGSDSWRMATATAFMFMAAGVATAWIGEARRAWRVPMLAAFVGLTAVGELIVMSVSGSRSIQATPLFSSVPLATTIGFLLLAGELLRRRPLDIADLQRRSGGKLGIDGWLLALVLAAVLPVLLFASIAAERLAYTERQEMLRDIERHTEATAKSVERSVRSMQLMAVTLANAPDAQRQDLSAFYALAKGAMAADHPNLAVLLIAPDGRQLLNTRQLFGAALPDFSASEVLADTIAKKTPILSGLYFGRVAQTNLFSVTAPVMRDGQVVAVVAYSGEPSALTGVLRDQRLPQGWIGDLVDSRGIVVARTLDPEAFVGRLGSKRLIAARATGRGGHFAGIIGDGVAATSYFVNLPDSGWTVVVDMPTSQLEAALSASHRFMLAVGLASLTIAGGLALLFGRHLSGGIADVARAAVAVGEGRKPATRATFVRELDLVAGALTAARALIDAREAALRESEQRLRLFVEHAPAALAMFDREMRYLEASRRWLDDFGLDRSSIARSHYELFPELGEAWKALHRHCLEGAVERSGEDRFERADGSHRWLKWEVRPWTDAQGAIGGLLICAEDISRQREVLARLEASTRRFELALGNSPITVFEQDMDLRYTWIYNSKIGLSESFVVGKTDDEFMDPAAAAQLKAVKRRALETGQPVRQEVMAAAPGNAPEYFDLNIEPRRNEAGEVIGLICIATDITARKQAEGALAASEEYNRSVFEVNPDCLKVIGIDGRIERMNANGQRLMEIDDFETVRGKRWSVLWPEEMRDRIEAAIAQAMAGESGHISAFGPTMKGTPKWWDVMVTAVRGADGSPIRLVAASRDITERKQAEEHSALLMKEVNHRAKNLLAVVQAVARQTSVKSDPAEFATHFGKRLAGLAASQDLLVQSEWKGVGLKELVSSQLAHFVELLGRRVTLEGPPVQITPTAAQAIGMAVHELATNAGKYGALSDAEGSVRIAWELVGGGTQQQFAMQWSEHDGPPCTQPNHRGFGYTVIVRMAEHALGAEVSLTYPRSGLVWKLSAPTERVLSLNPAPFNRLATASFR